MKRVAKWIGIVVLVVLTFFVIANWYSWDDGVMYLRDMFTYNPTPAQPLDAKGCAGVGL